MATSSRRPVEAGFTTARLMQYSEQFLVRTAQSEPSQTSQLAARLLEDKPLHRRWEHEHSRLMHGVAAPARAPDKVTELRRVSLLTLHRKAPFEYLRDRHVTGAARRYLIDALFGSQDYAQCLVREHLAFLSSACSFICADALCGEVLGDAAFSTALAHYQNAYTEYYRAYGDSLLAAHSGARTCATSSRSSAITWCPAIRSTATSLRCRRCTRPPATRNSCRSFRDALTRSRRGRRARVEFIATQLMHTRRGFFARFPPRRV